MLTRRVAAGLIGVALSLLFLGSLELVARWTHEPEPMRRVYDPFSYRIPHPSLLDPFETHDHRLVTIRTNELGMRGPSIAAATAPGTLTVVFLGGSTTENYAYNLEDTFPYLLGERLELALGRPVRVFNAGMSAATSSTSLGRLQHQVLDLEPDLVVVMHAINDLLGGFHSGFRADGRHLVRPPTVDWRPKSYLYDWARGVRNRRPRQRPHYVASRRIDSYNEFPALAVFERNLRSMAAIAGAHQVPIVFLTQGSMYEGASPSDADRFFMADSLVWQGMTPPDLPSLVSGMRAFNDVVEGFEPKSGALVFDLATRLDRSWENFVDDCHLTIEGNRVVAELLLPALEPILRAKIEATALDSHEVAGRASSSAPGR